MTPTDHDALVSLRDYVDARLKGVCDKMDARVQVVDAQIRGIEKSIEVAHHAMEIRLGSMNEIREQLAEQASRLASKETVEYNGRRIALLEQQVATIIGASTGKWQIAIIAAASVLTAVVTIGHMLFGK